MHSLINTSKFEDLVLRTLQRKLDTGLIPILDKYASNQQQLDLQYLMKRLTFDTICCAVLGFDPKSLSLELPHLDYAEAFDGMAEAILYRHCVPQSVWKFQKWLGVGQEAKMTKDSECFRGFLEERIKEKINNNDDDDDDEDDVLTQLILEAGRIGRSDLDFLRDVTFTGIINGRNWVRRIREKTRATLLRRRSQVSGSQACSGFRFSGSGPKRRPVHCRKRRPEGCGGSRDAGGEIGTKAAVEEEKKEDEKKEEEVKEETATPTTVVKAAVVVDDGAKTVEAIEETIVAVSSTDPPAAPESDLKTEDSKTEQPKTEDLKSESAAPPPAPEEVHIWGIKLLEDDKTDVVLLKFVRARDSSTGRDTVYAALSWFFWLVATNPDVEKNILEEMDQVIQYPTDKSNSIPSMEELKRLVYLEGAILETLRLYPSLPLELKQSLEADVLPSGHAISGGTKIIVSIYSMGRMEEIWGHDCMDFKPERWLGGGVSQHNIVHVPSYKFAAFNAGPRSCLGRKISITQIKVIASCVLRKYKIDVVEGHPVVPGLSVVLFMKYGLKITVSQRT
ncbi:Cytochrome P450 86B1 [Linum perenne]